LQFRRGEEPEGGPSDEQDRPLIDDEAGLRQVDHLDGQYAVAFVKSQHRLERRELRLLGGVGNQFACLWQHRQQPRALFGGDRRRTHGAKGGFDASRRQRLEEPQRNRAWAFSPLRSRRDGSHARIIIERLRTMGRPLTRADGFHFGDDHS
jgi:hypothetical protein